MFSESKGIKEEIMLLAQPYLLSSFVYVGSTPDSNLALVRVKESDS
jgi:hypothetical protein